MLPIIGTNLISGALAKRVGDELPALLQQRQLGRLLCRTEVPADRAVRRGVAQDLVKARPCR